ncbi:subtilisin-like protein [Trichoderma evansii]
MARRLLTLQVQSVRENSIWDRQMSLKDADIISFPFFLPVVLATPAAEKRAGLAPLIATAKEQDLIADQYIVKFKEGSSPHTIDEAITSITSEAHHVFQHVFRGFAGKFDQSTIDLLRSHPDVEYIERDAVVRVNAFVSQTDAPWGLGRVSHIALGSTTYVIDTGVDATNPEFEGRATLLKSFVPGEDTDDSDIWCKVLYDDGAGSTSDTIAGMEYVASDTQTLSCPYGTVVNMSFGVNTFSNSSNQAAASLVSFGLFLSVAAGNSGVDAANVSPASEPTVCTVGGTNSTDARVDWSNYGAVLDIFAPGQDVLSTWLDNTTEVLWGTSMAAPHITGLGAYLLALEGPDSPRRFARVFKSFLDMTSFPMFHLAPLTLLLSTAILRVERHEPVNKRGGK